MAQNFQLQQPGFNFQDLILPGLSGLSGLLQGFGGGAQKDALRSQTRIGEAREQRRSGLHSDIRGGLFGTIGGSLANRGQQQAELGQFQQSLQPFQNQLLQNQSRLGQLGSPEGLRELQQGLAPILAGRSAQIMNRDIGRSDAQTRFLMSLLGGTV